jgi:hypothetical protein
MRCGCVKSVKIVMTSSWSFGNDAADAIDAVGAT